MKASEVLQRYSAGERNFQRVNLRGQSFKNQTLSGADFSEADIRGANFSGTTLRGVKFVGTKAGLQRRWVAVELIFALVMSLFSRFLAVIPSWFAFAVVTVDESLLWQISIGASMAIVLIATEVAIARQGFTAQAFSKVAIAVAVVVPVIVSVAIAVAGVTSINAAEGVAFAIAVALVIILTGVVVLAITGVAIVAVIVAGVVVGAIVGVVIEAVATAIVVVIATTAVVVVVALGGVVSIAVALGEIIAVALGGSVLLYGFYVAWRALEGDEKFALVRQFAIAFASLGGTRFYAADLAEADFTRATLKSTNFRQATLTRTCWHNANKLDRARPGNTILAQPAVRDLLVTGNGYNQDFSHANLSGANLDGATLENANLRGANLERATLHGANLKNANLSQTLAIGTNFSRAYLTGACLEAWNIDATTNLENVDCQYIFLLEHDNAMGHRERRPHDPNTVFQPGDFAQLYTKMMNVVQLLLRDGYNPEAFRQAFAQLMAENPEITPESIQSFEKKGKDVLVTLEVSETTDKGKVERTFTEAYVARLEAQVEAQKLHNQDLKENFLDLKEISLALAHNQTPTVNLTNTNTAQNKTMSDNPNIQTGDIKGIFAGSVGGNFDASGAVLNIDNINSTITTKLNELSPSPEPEKPGAKELLTQLQAAINAEAEMNEEDKAEALEQVQNIAEAAQNPQESGMKKLAKKAVTMLKGLAAGLPTAAALVTACNELLPQVAQLFGL